MQCARIVALSVAAAVAHGILHDQVTARLCVEYFTVGHPIVIATDDPTRLALLWGVLATWWVGALLGVLLALFSREGLKVPSKRREKRAPGAAANACHIRSAEHKDHVWCWDFVFDRTTSSSPLKWLSIVDEHTRECLALKVDRGITSEDMIDTLAELFAMRGVPRAIRSDNGPEFVAQSIRRWLKQVDVTTLYIEPGSPWQNGYAESFHSRFRDEFLAREVFESLVAARRLTAAWRDDYNHHRPHSSLEYAIPAEFAARCAASAPGESSASATPLPPLQQHSGCSQTPAFIPSGTGI